MIRRKSRTNKPHNAQSDLPAQTVNSFQKVLQDVPVDETQQNMLANEFVIWVMKNQPLCIEEFPLQKLMCPDELFALVDSNPYFAKAYTFVRKSIAFRIKDGWERGEIDANYAIRMLYQYDDVHRQYCLQKTNVQAMGKAGERIVTVEFDQIPDSPLVKRVTDSRVTDSRVTDSRVTDSRKK